MTARPLRPSEVLDEHVKLEENLRHLSAQTKIYFDGFMDSVLNDAERTGGKDRRDAARMYLFHPASNGREFAAVLARQLTFARTYQVTADMTDAVTATYQKTLDTVDHVDEQEVPSEAGFCWLDKPMEFTDVRGKRVLHRALSWDGTRVRFSDGDVWQGIRITAWCHTDDEDDFWDKDTMASLKSIGFGGLTLSHSVIIPFGQRFLRRKDLVIPHGMTDPLMDQLTLKGGGPVGDDLARWSHTLFMFLDMELVTTSTKAPVERHVRKRAAKSLKHGEVNVITLRRVHHAKEGEPGHRFVDWSCRWPVQGFWRHIEEYDTDLYKRGHHAIPDIQKEHCDVCGARITWVRPHLRGPSDKPLKAIRGTVERLSR